MNRKTIISTSLRAIAYAVLAPVLLVLGVIVALYSPWVQDIVRSAIVDRYNGTDSPLELSLDTFRLRFPLTIEADGVAMLQSGDTIMAAQSVDINVAILPLLIGNVSIDEVRLQDAHYRMGGPDSTMYLNLAADSIGISPAKIRLSDMLISLDEAAISGARMALILNPDTSAPTPPAPPTKMSFKIGRLHLNDFAYTMRMMPTIDTLSTHIAEAVLEGGNIDLFTQNIHLNALCGSGLDAAYIAPDSTSIATFDSPTDIKVNDTLPAATPWTIEIDSIAFANSHALYTTAGTTPAPGLDFAYIEVDSVDLRIRDFYNCQSIIRLPLSIRGTERCGVALAIDGQLDLDEKALTFSKANLSTKGGTTAAFEGILGMGDMATDPSLPLRLNLDGAFAPNDLEKMFPAFKAYLCAIPSAEDIVVVTDLDGTTGRLDINELSLRLNRCINLDGKGYIEHFMTPSRLAGNVALRGNIINVDPLKNAILDPSTAKMLTIPPMTLNGNVTMRYGAAVGRLTAKTASGDIRFDGKWNGNSESYLADITTNSFPISAFMPSLGLGNITSNIHADGSGYDPFNVSTVINANANIASIFYQNKELNDISANLSLSNGQAYISADSPNIDADLGFNASGNLDGDLYTWTLNLDGRHIDLYTLGFTTEASSLELNATANASVSSDFNDIDAQIDLSDLYFKQLSGTIGFNDVDLALKATDSLTTVGLKNRDLSASFRAPSSLDSLITQFSKVSDLLSAQIDSYLLDIDTLGRTLPHFSLDVRGGHSNLVNDILYPSNMSIRSFELTANNDSSLVLDGIIRRFDTGSMVLDTITIAGKKHGDHLHFGANLTNRPGNLEQWHKVVMNGTVEGNEAHIGLHQENIKGDTGYQFGLAAQALLPDSTIIINVKPHEPIIGYQQWIVNDDNFLSMRLSDHHIDANLHMTGGNSALDIYKERTPGVVAEVDSTGFHSYEDLVVRLANIHISDWISFNPFAPPVKGDVNADMRINRWSGKLVGKGEVGISNFIYGKEHVADFKSNFDVSASKSGTINAKADLIVNGKKTITLAGALNDSTATSPLNLDLDMIHFPLSAANPFMPQGSAKLKGMLNGKMSISGTEAQPIINGTLDFDSTAVTLALTGTPYRFSESPIMIENSVIQLDKFTIEGCNENPLYIDGSVDISDMTNYRVNIDMNADNMMIVNSNKAPKGADVYGKAYVSLDANAHGTASFMAVNADIRLLSSTNVTYVIPDATSALTNQSNEDMVKFVNFTDTLLVAKPDTIANSEMAMILDATLSIEDGSLINVNLSPDGKDRASIQSNGTLSFAMTPLDDGRLSGRLNIDNGYVRYTPPFMSEKHFDFDEGSYVLFNGDMMNPTLNISASDQVKTTVSQGDHNSRPVNFDITLGITGTLDRMDVAFDLSTNDDITIANELETMSKEQRANQAMNLLLYNMYTGHSSIGDTSLGGNALFSFLESQINSWAANNIKGIDISFGIDQYDSSADGSRSSSMSYSYQVSKSLFNDRFKIVVGGNYSTDADADENFSQNLINDISFEYFLNKQRTMSLRLFRHTGYESILEGEITQTGVGFVYRRKIRRFGDMFLSPKQVRARELREATRSADEITPQE